jgi:hypothetical protein
MSKIAVITEVFTAVGTVAVSILAIWGPAVKAMLAGPRLEVSLRKPNGDLTFSGDATKAIYYHLSVRNLRTWSPAEAVRILVVGISKRRLDGSFFPEPVIAPLQLTWAFPGFHELFPTIAATPETCDLGFLEENSGRFRLSTYIVPNNFRGYLERGEALRVQIIASGHNVRSARPLMVEVSWDGSWSTDLDEMQRHLVIKEVTQS